MNKIAEDYLFKSKENYELYEFLAKSNKFVDWQITALFYSALCLIKAYFFNKNEREAAKINNHDLVNRYLSLERETKNLGIIHFYRPLYAYSRDARYHYKKIKQFHIEDALIKLKKIQSLLKLS